MTTTAPWGTGDSGAAVGRQRGHAAAEVRSWQTHPDALRGWALTTAVVAGISKALNK